MSVDQDLEHIRKLADALFERFGFNDGEYSAVCKLELGPLPGEDEQAIVVDDGAFYVSRMTGYWTLFLPIGPEDVEGRPDLEAMVADGAKVAECDFAATTHQAACLIVTHWLEGRMLEHLAEIDPDGVEEHGPDVDDDDDDKP